MPKISFKFKNSTYLPYSDDNYSLSILGIFLISDVSGVDGFEFFYNWIKDPTRTGISCNTSGLDKIGNKVHMYLFFEKSTGSRLAFFRFS